MVLLHTSPACDGQIQPRYVRYDASEVVERDYKHMHRLSLCLGTAHAYAVTTGTAYAYAVTIAKHHAQIQQAICCDASCFGIVHVCSHR